MLDVSDQSVRLGSLTSTNPTSLPSTSRPSASARNSTITTTNSSDQPTEEDVRIKPWKYIGYKGYSELLASDNDFAIYRKFEVLNTRIALSLQDELSVLESELDKIDRKYSKKSAEDVHNGTFRDDQEDRADLVEKIRAKLERYNGFMLQQSKLKAFPPANRPDVKSLKNWHYNHGGFAINTEEQKYLDQASDLFCLVPKAKTPLRRFLDRSRAFRIHPLWRQSENRPDANLEPGIPSTDRDLILSLSDKRIDRFITFLILGFGTAMLIAPMWILEVLTSPMKKLGVITLFIVLFLVMLSAVTVAKPFETLAAAAAYSAVLMVFLQLGGTGNG